MTTEYGFSPEHEFVSQPIKYLKTETVCEGVRCDVYQFTEDDTKDLGVIRIQPGFSTPRQRVLEGERTIEGYISGIGQLVVDRSGGDREVYPVDDNLPERLQVDVNVGDIMQWQAAQDSPLVVFEICIPPYQDGRYKNLE